MPRGPREWSETGYYHVVIKGNAAMRIFETDADRHKFLDIVARYREEMGFVVIAWCLMSNHVHILIDAGERELGPFMKKVEVSYVQYFNSKKGRVGHLFQGRYFSKPVTTDKQLLATVDYIHMNPARARIAKKEDYPWSSYSEYVGKPFLSDVSVVLSLLGGVEAFRSFAGRPSEAVHASRRTVRVSDEQALAMVRERFGEDALVRLRGNDRARRDEMMVALSGLGIPTPQIARLAEVGDNTVRRALRNACESE